LFFKRVPIFCRSAQLGVGVFVIVGVSVIVGVFVGVRVIVGVFVGAGVSVGGGVGVQVPVPVGVGVRVGVGKLMELAGLYRLQAESLNSTENPKWLELIPPGAEDK
jgi:hypothetical protein